jgi:hypothetical protein
MDLEQVQLSIHAAAVEHFPQSLREELYIPRRSQGQGPIIVRNINLDTFTLYYKYIYTRDYLVLEMRLISHSSSQKMLRLKEADT